MMRRSRRGQRGAIMVQALIVLAGLVALMATLAANQRVTLQATQNVLRTRRAEAAARSAVARATAVLSTANTNLLLMTDDWAILGGTKATRSFEMGDGNTTFRMEILDAGSRIDLNRAPEAHLLQLPITQEQVDSLLDWREATTNARTDGAKDDYYTGLDTPYNTKLGNLTTVDEILLVKNWTAYDLLVPQTNVATSSTAGTPVDEDGNPLPLIDMVTVDSGAPSQRADGTARINIAQARLTAATFTGLGISNNVATLLATRGPFTNFAQLLATPGIAANDARQLLDAVAFTGGDRIQGKINLNTASQAVLQTIPNLTPDIAQAIVQQQSTGFQTLGDLANVPGVNTTILPQIADYFTVGSDTWIVRAYGESGGVGVAIEAVVGIRNGRAQAITWSRLPEPAIPAWWSWDTETTETVDAGGGL